jgi:peptide/nickel transport system substrate-binding protein
MVEKSYIVELENVWRIYEQGRRRIEALKDNRFNGRFAYGLGDGLSKYTLVTADTKDKVVRATQFSAQGSLFMSAWDSACQATCETNPCLSPR